MLEKIKEFGNKSYFDKEPSPKTKQAAVFIFIAMSSFFVWFGVSHFWFFIILIVFIGIYLYYIFQPKIISEIIFIFLILFGYVSVPYLIYKFGKIERRSSEILINKLAPGLIGYKIFIISAAYGIFELLLFVISKFSFKVRYNMKHHATLMRLYFVIILVIICSFAV